MVSVNAMTPEKYAELEKLTALEPVGEGEMKWTRL
jgi:hypothetical protein